MAALLLAVPVAVAAAIGFNASLAGLGEGLDAFASGPERSADAPGGGSAALDDAIVALASPDAPATSPGGGDGGGGGGGGAPAPGSGPGGSTGPGQPSGTAPDTGVPPVDDGDVQASNVIGGALDQVGETVKGVLGGGP